MKSNSENVLLSTDPNAALLELSRRISVNHDQALQANSAAIELRENGEALERVLLHLARQAHNEAQNAYLAAEEILSDIQRLYALAVSIESNADRWDRMVAQTIRENAERLEEKHIAAKRAAENAEAQARVLHHLANGDE